jgi:large subunit ribosomal protein L24
MKRPKSKKPRKQRKFLFKAPLHLRRKMLAAHLSKELKEKYKRRSLPVRVGDEVEIMRGEFKKKRGKIVKVDLKKYKVYVEGITRKTSTGTEKLVPIHPSNLRIINLNLADKWRVKILERKGVKIG